MLETTPARVAALSPAPARSSSTVSWVKRPSPVQARYFLPRP